MCLYEHQKDVGRDVHFRANVYRLPQCGVPANLGVVAQVSAGDFHTCAIDSEGQLHCFGDISRCESFDVSCSRGMLGRELRSIVALQHVPSGSMQLPLLTIGAQAMDADVSL